MPLTPFHFGLGCLLKGVLPSSFSLAAFIVSQVFIDMETLWNILSEHDRVHTFFHTYLGVLIPSLAATVLVGSSLRLFMSRFARSHPAENSPSPFALTLGGFSGG